MDNLTFPDALRLIDDRSAAFRAALAAAPDLGAKVPTCPEWTVTDLAHHLAAGRRKWAAIVTAGPADAPPPASAWPSTPAERDAPADWLAATTGELLDALRTAGPDRGCWSWWGRSQSPQTTGAAARRQLHELAVHTYDAQLAAGAPQPLPTEIALDGADEFLTTCCATTVAWPHQPALVNYHTAEGRSWRLTLSADGARISPLPASGDPDVEATATASDLVLGFYNRVPLTTWTITGDHRIIDQLVDWSPDA